MRDLSFEGKTTIFKTLAISKLARHGLIASVPVFIIEQLNIIKQIFCKEKKPKIKHSTLQNTYKLGSFKDTDIFYKILVYYVTG